jgi:AraC-like DNA-binding protein
MLLTEDLTQCETVPAWARALCHGNGGQITSFGHCVIDSSPTAGVQPQHNAVELVFANETPLPDRSAAETHYAKLLQMGTPSILPVDPRMPSLRLTLDREHFDSVVKEHFTGIALPEVTIHTFLRSTPHGRGIYSLAEALLNMVNQRTDLLSRYCLEIALIKAIALAPPSMNELQHRGETWGPMMRRVEKAASFLMLHVQEPFHLRTVAAAAECGERSLSEAFQRVLNLTPLQFHRHCRLEASYRDLMMPGASVSRVAMQYGFENLGRFATAFRERFGINPSEVSKG